MLELRRPAWITLPALRRGGVASLLVGVAWIAADGLQQLYADVPVWGEENLAFGAVLGLLALPLVAVEEGAQRRGLRACLGVWLTALVILPLAVLGASMQATFAGELLRGTSTAEATRVVFNRLAFSAPRLGMELGLALRWAAPLLAVFALRLGNVRLLPQIFLCATASGLAFGLHVDLLHRAVDPTWSVSDWTWSGVVNGPLAANTFVGIALPIALRVARPWEDRCSGPNLEVKGTRKRTPRERVEVGLALLHTHRRWATRAFALALIALLYWGWTDPKPAPEVEVEVDAASQWMMETASEWSRSEDARGWMRQARESLKSGDYHLASAQAGWAIEADPEYVPAYLIRIDALSLQGRYDAARVTAGQLISIQPSSPWAYFSRGFAASRCGDYETAVVDYSSAIALYPTERWLYWHRSVARRSVGDEAGGALDMAIARTTFPAFDHSPLWLLDSR